MPATAELAQRSGVSFAQIVMLTPFPGTVDFAWWEQQGGNAPTIDGIPLTRYWRIPPSRRPKVYTPHPTLSAEAIREGTQAVWGSVQRAGGHLAALHLRAVHTTVWRLC